MPATHEELRELFVRHGAVDTFDRVEEILDRIDQRAEHHANEPRAAIEILRGDQSVNSVAPSSPWIYIVDGSVRFLVGHAAFPAKPDKPCAGARGNQRRWGKTRIETVAPCPRRWASGGSSSDLR